MAMMLEIRVLELLCSRLCHDLIGPVSAIGNGMELMEEVGGEGGEAMELVRDSAAQASARLALFRLAHGIGRAEDGMTLADASSVLADWFAAGRVRLDWRVGEIASFRPGALKILLNLALVAEETVAAGGELRIDPFGNGFRIVATGKGAALRPGTPEALAGAVSVSELTPRTVQAYFTGRLAAQSGLALDIQEGGPGVVAFIIDAA